jgi:hypothetical protein
MILRPPRLSASVDPLLVRLRRWQTARSWARLIREAEALWRVDVRVLRRLAAMELAAALPRWHAAALSGRLLQAGIGVNKESLRPADCPTPHGPA